MNITDTIIKLDPSLKEFNEGSWGEPYKRSKGFSSFNDAGIECETGEFLYSMVRLLKPARVLETGTHWGIGASYMGLALKDNQSGILDTIEFLPEIYKIAHERIKTIGLTDYVNSFLTDATTFDPGEKVSYQLILLDTEPQTRFAELLRFYEYLSPGGFVFIHDLHQHMHQIPNAEHGFAWPFGTIPQALADLVKTDSLRPFHFKTPRGLTGFYKVDPKDYDWRT